MTEIDILKGKITEKIIDDCHGKVILLDVMPRVFTIKENGIKTSDRSIVEGARVSIGEGLKSENADKGLISYLMRHQHTSPVELIEFKFYIKCPFFIARQWFRHRTGNFNER